MLIDLKSELHYAVHAKITFENGKWQNLSKFNLLRYDNEAPLYLTNFGSYHDIQSDNLHTFLGSFSPDLRLVNLTPELSLTTHDFGWELVDLHTIPFMLSKFVGHGWR